MKIRITKVPDIIRERTQNSNPQDMPTGQYGGMYPTGGPVDDMSSFYTDRLKYMNPPISADNRPNLYTGDHILGQPSYNNPLFTSNPQSREYNDMQALPVSGPQAMNATPDTFSPTPTNMQQFTPGNNMGTVDPDKGNTKVYPHKAAFTSPDTYGMYLRTLQAATVPHDLVYRAPVTGVIPDAVYQDPRRAMASIAEQANSRGRDISQLSGPGRQANLLQLQGQAGTQAANVAGEYANKNAMIANEANQRAAGITNQILEQQRERSNDLVRDTSNANLQYKKRQNEANSNLLNKYTEAWTNRQGYNDLNQTNQFYKRDPRTGLMYFNSPEAKAAFDKATNGVPGSAGKIRSISELKQSYIDSGGDPDHAAEFADDAYREQYGLRNKSVSTHNEGKNNTKTTTYNPQKYGGSITNQNLQKFFKKTLLS